MSGEGCGELLIFDLNSPIFSKIDACVVLHDANVRESPYSKLRIADNSNSHKAHSYFKPEELERNKEVLLLGIDCAIDMPAALETALDDPKFLVTALDSKVIFTSVG
jgi:hypothetical protein